MGSVHLLLRRQAKLRDVMRDGPTYGGLVDPRPGVRPSWGAARLDGAPRWDSRMDRGRVVHSAQQRALTYRVVGKEAYMAIE